MCGGWGGGGGVWGGGGEISQDESRGLRSSFDGMGKNSRLLC